MQATTDDPYAGRRARSIKLPQAIDVLVGLIETVLLIRFLLKALGANADAGFAQVVYGITGVLVAPFGGLDPGDAAAPPSRRPVPGPLPAAARPTLGN